MVLGLRGTVWEIQGLRHLVAKTLCKRRSINKKKYYIVYLRSGMPFCNEVPLGHAPWGLQLQAGHGDL